MSSLTRAAVTGESMAAFARGEQLTYGEDTRIPLTLGTFDLTRSEVRAELLAPVERGEPVTLGGSTPRTRKLVGGPWHRWCVRWRQV